MIWLVFSYAVMTALCYRGSRMVNRQITARWTVRFFLYRWGIMTQPADMFPKR